MELSKETILEMIELAANMRKPYELKAVVVSPKIFWALPPLLEGKRLQDCETKKTEKLMGIPVIISMIQGEFHMSFNRADGIVIKFPVMLPKDEKEVDES